MTIAILKGIGMGMVLAISVGPVFFTLLKTSLEKGFKSGIYLALGISMNDIFFIALVYLGLSNFLMQPENQSYLKVFGGIVLILFGVYSIVKKKKIGVSEGKSINGNGNTIKLILKGFIVNGINPAVLFFWAATFAMGVSEFGSDSQSLLLFFSAIVATVFITDVTKAFLANKIKGRINARLVSKVYWIMGLVFVGFGIRLFIDGF